VIEWISEWLKQIIILVLIATFIDLLLPNNALDRYVKLVMGLLIIMAILTPIFQLLSEKYDLSALAFTHASHGERLASLQQIREQGERLKTTQDRLIQEQSSKQMELSIKEQVEQKFGVEVMESNVTLQTGPKGMAEIKHIHVRASASAISPHQMGGKPVQPVYISVGEREPASPKENQAGNKLAQDIANYLSDAWHVRQEQVQVTVDSL
jgi:stage III sporulation protein AF